VTLTALQGAHVSKTQQTKPAPGSDKPIERGAQPEGVLPTPDLIDDSSSDEETPAECVVNVEMPQPKCSARLTCELQGGFIEYPFYDYPRVSKILARKSTMLTFMEEFRSKERNAGERGAVAYFRRMCSKHEGYFGMCRNYARALNNRPGIPLQSLSDSIPKFSMEDHGIYVDLLVFSASVYDLLNSKSKRSSRLTQLASIVYFFVRSPSFSKLKDLSPDVLPWFGKTFGEELVLQGALDVRAVITTASKLSQFGSTPFFQGIVGICLSLSALPIFGMGAKLLDLGKFLVDAKYNPGLGFWPNLERVFSALKLAWDSGDYWILFSSNNPTVWAMKAQTMELCASTPDPIGTVAHYAGGRQRGDAQYWYDRLTEHLATGDMVREPNRDFIVARTAVFSRLHVLRSILSANKPQPQPFFLVLGGSPGFGKTDIIPELAMLATHVHEPLLRGEELLTAANMRTYRKSLDPQQAFWQGYVNQDVLVLEDVHAVRVGNLLPSLVTEFVNIYGGTPSMASIEDKARTKVNAKLVLATTNRDTLTIQEYDVVQVARRVTYYVSVEPNEFARDYFARCGLPIGQSPFTSLHTWPFTTPNGEAVNLFSKENQALSFAEWTSRGYPSRLHSDTLCEWTVHVGASVEGQRLIFNGGEKLVTFSTRTEFLKWFSEIYSEYRLDHVERLKRKMEPPCELGFARRSHNGQVDPHPGCTCCYTEKPVELQGFMDYVPSSYSKFDWERCLTNSTIGAFGMAAVSVARLAFRLNAVAERSSTALEIAAYKAGDLGSEAIRSLREVRFEGRKVLEYLKTFGKFVSYFLTVFAVVQGVRYFVADNDEDDETVRTEAVVGENPINLLREGRLRELELIREPRPSTVQRANQFAVGYARVDVKEIPVGPTLEQFHSIVGSATVPVKVLVEGESQRAFGFKISGTHFAFPSHIARNYLTGFLPDKFQLEVGHDGIISYKRMHMVDLAPGGNAQVLPNCDLIVVKMVDAPGRALLNHFGDKLGGVHMMHFRGAPAGGCDLDATETMVFANPAVACGVNRACYKVVNCPGQAGDCGSLYYGEVRGKLVIIGCHLSTKNNDAVVMPLFHSDFARFAAPEVALSPVAAATLQSATMDPLDSKTTVLDVPNLSIQPLGRLRDYIVGTNKSCAVKTLLYPYFAPKAPKVWAPPFLGRGLVHDGKWCTPFISRYSGNPNRAGPPTADFVAGLKSYMQTVKPVRVSPLTDDEMFAGTGEAYAGPLNLATSMGLPWTFIGKSPKSKLVVREGSTYKVDPDLVSAIVETERALLRAPVRVLEHMIPKDEVVTLEKSETAATRLFAVCSGEINMLGRKYLLPIMKIFYDQRESTGMMPGVNCFGPEWDKLAKSLLTYDGYFSGDQKKYDAKHRAEFFYACADELYGLCLACGYAPEEALIAGNLVRSAAHHLIVYRGDVFVSDEQLGSGWFLTTFINCLIHGALIDAIFIMRIGKVPAHTKLLYGDDFVLSLSKSLGFTQLDLRDGMAIFGYEMTSSRKGEELQPYDQFEQVTFLKRSFRYNDLLGRWVAPIERETLFRCLMWRLESSIGDTERCSIVSETVQLEAFLWGRDTYDEFTSILSTSMGELKLPWKNRTFQQCVDYFMVEEPTVVIPQGSCPSGSNRKVGNPLSRGSYTQNQFSAVVTRRTTTDGAYCSCRI
jgi:hypothetical protein